MRLAVALVVCASGCAQLFGLDPTTGGGSSNDASPPPSVSLRIQRLSIGARVVTEPQDVTRQTASYEIPDASAPSGLRAVPAMQSSVDTWTAPIADGTPPIEFTLPDYPMPVSRFYALPGRTLVGLYGWLEHPNPTPAPPGAMLAVDVNLGAAYTGAEAYQLYTIGSWTARGLPPPAANSSVLQASVPFDQPGVSIAGSPVEKLTVDDAVLVLRYLGNELTGFYRNPGFDQTGNDPIAGNLVSFTKDQSLAMTIHPDAVPARYANLRPAVGAPSMAYYLAAAPGYAYVNTTGPQLNAVSVAATDPGTVSLAYANPFTGEGWQTVLTWATSASRTYMIDTLPVTLYAAMNQFTEPTAGIDLALPAGLPTSISIDQTPLLDDGMMVAIDPTKAVDLSFVPDQPGATLSQMQVFELVPNATGTAQQYQLRLAATGVEPHFVVPPDVFVVGHHYTLRAVSLVGGYPGAASGDLTMRALPMAQSYADSGVFTVVSG